MDGPILSLAADKMLTSYPHTVLQLDSLLEQAVYAAFQLRYKAQIAMSNGSPKPASVN